MCISAMLIILQTYILWGQVHCLSFVNCLFINILMKPTENWNFNTCIYFVRHKYTRSNITECIHLLIQIDVLYKCVK